MYKKLFIIFLLILFSTNFFAQNNKNSKVKTNWNMGLLPTITYNTDLGFQYGLLTNFYYYGNGDIYPKYYHSIFLEISRFTRGKGVFRLFYDSKYLIKGIRTTFDIGYFPDQTLNFYGFNGYQSVYNTNWEDDKNKYYKTRIFYKHKRNLLRGKIDIQGNTKFKNINWATGLFINNIDIETTDRKKLNKGQKKSKILPDTTTLYDEYVSWGIIKPNEAKGGFIGSIKAGLVYDSRDNEPNPTSGIWSEMVIIQNFSKNHNYTKLCLTHRQYFTLIKNRLTFVYRIAYQGVIAGKIPFYALPFLNYSYNPSYNSEGLGGSKTVRGIVQSRVVGKAMAFANFELRWNFIQFQIFKQNIDLVLSPFSDIGQVVDNYEINKLGIPKNVNKKDYFNDKKDKPHITYGLGLHIAMNKNFVVSADFGMPINKQDGKNGFYINMNYLF